MRVEGEVGEGGRKPRVVVVLKSEKSVSSNERPKLSYYNCLRSRDLIAQPFPGHSGARTPGDRGLAIDRMYICVLECVVFPSSQSLTRRRGEFQRGEEVDKLAEAWGILACSPTLTVIPEL